MLGLSMLLDISLKAMKRAKALSHSPVAASPLAVSSSVFPSVAPTSQISAVRTNPPSLAVNSEEML